MQFVESTLGHPSAVDRDSMIIHNVKVIGKKSKNGREYSDDAMKKLVGMYENISINVDHDRKNPGSERTMAAGFGVLRDVKLGDDGAYGDIHYLQNHPMAGVILERAERMPESFGMSHNAEGRVVRQNGKLIVEDVAKVHSVDIVREPATTEGLFESQDGPDYDVDRKTLREVVESLPEDTPGLAFLTETLDAGVVGENTTVEMAPGTGSSEQLKMALRAAVLEAFDDESLDFDGTLAQIEKILTIQRDLQHPEPESEPEEEDHDHEEASDENPAEEEEKKMKESVDTETNERIAILEAKNMLLESGREATPERVRAVAAVGEDDRELLVDSWPLKESVSRPESSPSKYTNKAGEAFDFPRDTKQFADRLR